jgi:hypothetical protein
MVQPRRALDGGAGGTVADDIVTEVAALRVLSCGGKYTSSQDAGRRFDE